MNDGMRVLSVLQLNTYIKSIIDYDKNLKAIYVKGEISDFIINKKSGHAYFSLKDMSASIKIVMFSSDISNVEILPKDGMDVVVFGKLIVYEKKGYFQILAKDIRLEGVGVEYNNFTKLKNKFEREGLFDKELKKPLPLYPERIGVISSINGDAIKDILSILSKRWPYCKIFIYPCNVQGDKAKPDIINALEYFSFNQIMDVIIVARGGGAYEDLSVFNDEKIVYAVAASKTPIVSAIGHENDFTLIDYVSDFRASTPSVAAEAICPDINSVKKYLFDKKSLLCNNMGKKLYSEISKLYYFKTKMDSSNFMYKNYQSLKNIKIRILNNLKIYLNNKKYNKDIIKNRLYMLNQENNLKRGYSIAYDESKILSKMKDFPEGKTFSLKIKDGVINCVRISEK